MLLLAARIERLKMALRSDSMESKKRNLNEADNELVRLSKLYLDTGCGCNKY